MADELSVETIRTAAGYDFLRSDGLHFFLVNEPDGRAVLHKGRRWPNPPTLGLIEFDASVFPKVEAARQWILAYQP
jgi:hypothetical protein